MKKGAAVLALLVMAATALVPAHRAEAGNTAAATPVNLLSQTPWIQSRGNFQLRVSFADQQPGDQVEVLVYEQVITRTDFDRAANGTVDEYSFYHPLVPVTALAPDPAGGYDINLPVNQAAAAGAPFGPVNITGEQNGVNAVQVQVYDASGVARGGPLTTFLTFSQGTAKSQGYEPLSTAVIVPYGADPVVSAQGTLQGPGPTDAARLDQLADALNNDNTVPISLLASPATLAGLQAGAKTSTVDRDAIGNIAGAPAGNLMQLLPTTWSPVSLGDLATAGLSSEIGLQISVAGDDLYSQLGSRPGTTTWAVDGPLDEATLQAITAQGGTQLIVPDSDLTSLVEQNTLVHASKLGATSATVYAADPGLAADFTRKVGPVLAGNILLADMAMIFSEAPGDATTGGIVAMPPAGSAVDPTLISTLLSGMAGDPLLNPVTATGLFNDAGTTKTSPRYLSAPNPPESTGAAELASVSTDITNARSKINELSSVLPDQAAQGAGIGSALLLAESESLTPQQRSAVLGAIARSTDVLNNAVTLPPPSSITLTATQGQIPITILSAANLQPDVELRLSSPRLIFLLFKPPDGTCTVPNPQEEDCALTLKTQNTTLEVPVETRSSGVFPLDVTLTAPGSSRAIAHDQDTVRSTAVSDVAIALIGLALAGLAYWWVRDIRRGRRPKGMVPTPGDPEFDADAGYLEEFFSRPPPTYGDGPMSPTGRPGGPTTDPHGSGRETRE